MSQDWRPRRVWRGGPDLVVDDDGLLLLLLLLIGRGPDESKGKGIDPDLDPFEVVLDRPVGHRFAVGTHAAAEESSE